MIKYPILVCKYCMSKSIFRQSYRTHFLQQCSDLFDDNSTAPLYRNEHIESYLCSFLSKHRRDEFVRRCLSPRVCVCHPGHVFVTQGMCLSPRVCVCHPGYVFVTQGMCLSPRVCVCHPGYVFVTQGMCGQFVFSKTKLAFLVCVGKAQRRDSCFP